MTGLHALTLRRAHERGWVTEWDQHADGSLHVKVLVGDIEVVIELANELQIDGFCLGLAVAS